jgi:hypothetical protein
VPHPAYGPDRGRSNFFVFGHLKLELQGIVMRSQPEVISAIREILNEILKKRFWLYGNPG